MPRPIQHEGGVFQQLHEALTGEPVDVSDLDLSKYSRELVEEARKVWSHRVQTEFRSIQIMNRFVTEVLGSGDPLEAWAPAVDLVMDEVRHTALCVALARAFGAEPRFPDPVELKDPERYLAAPMPQRAIATAISMLAINETISVGYIEDLQARCTEPAVKRVLDATLEDEEGHQDYGWAYVEKSLARFPIYSLGDFRHLVKTTLARHEKNADAALADVPDAERTLDAHPEPEPAALGLLSPVRQALVYQRTRDEVLVPRLRELGLA